MNTKHSKESIIDIGCGLIRRNGYHHTGINDILKASGIPKGSFYNYFESKEDFMEQVLDYYGQYTLRLMQNALRDRSKSPLQRLKAFYAFMSEANAEEAFANGCLVGNTSNEVGGQNERLASATDRQFRQWVVELSACIAQGQAEGEITNAYTPEEIATFLHQSFLGALARMKVLRDHQPLLLQQKMLFELIEA